MHPKELLSDRPLQKVVKVKSKLKWKLQDVEMPRSWLSTKKNCRHRVAKEITRAVNDNWRVESTKAVGAQIILLICYKWSWRRSPVGHWCNLSKVWAS